MAQAHIVAAIKALKDRPEVASVSSWNDGARYYVNLTSVNRRAKGDGTTKIWIDGRSGVISFEMGRGTSSSEFLGACDALKEFSRTLGTATYDHPGIWDLKVQIAA
jgi:hypothetical protein